MIAGTARGRRLVAPAGTTTRPTPDRVREATFNALGSLGAVADATVLDLFAGSGALGIEALSRGAARCTFVDADRPARAAVEANLATCGHGRLATVVAAPAERFLADWARRRHPFDLAFLDPPYELRRVGRPARRAAGRPRGGGVRPPVEQRARVGGPAGEALRPHPRHDPATQWA